MDSSGCKLQSKLVPSFQRPMHDAAEMACMFWHGMCTSSSYYWPVMQRNNLQQLHAPEC